jgi:adenylate cyclase
MRLTLRGKILLLFVMLALIPLGVSSFSMITVTRDELKSSVNDSLVNTADQLAREIDNLYMNVWRAPLLLIRRAVDNPNLGVEEKVALLASGIQDIEDFMAIQLTVEGYPPALFIKENFKINLEAAGLDPSPILQMTEGESQGIKRDRDGFFTGDLIYIPQTDDWLISIVVPLEEPVGGYFAAISARVNLRRLRDRFADHPFNRIGSVLLVNSQGNGVFDPEKKSLTGYSVVQTAQRLLESGVQAVSVEPFTGPEGRAAMLGGYAIPSGFPWAVIVTIAERDAYLVVEKMQNYLTFWLVLGLIAAVLGAVVFSGRITRPILEIGSVVEQVGRGNLNVRVSGLKSRDEISELGQRINGMIQGLLERFHLQKFVSGQTLDAVKQAGMEGVRLGGERKYATVFFSDIRNFTSFSEKVEPEIVIEMLNTYLRAQAKIVRKHQGDIDKFVGDELVAVFQGKDMVKNAVLCADEIQQEMARLNRDRSEWDIGVGIGINTGHMVMGAMGSEERMDYTILGDAVNLGARLCSQAGAGKIILSETAYQEISGLGVFECVKKEPIKVKGKAEPVQIYEVAGCLLKTEGETS